MERRLKKRYMELVKEHLNASNKLSSGLKALPGTRSAFASTQAAWRFYRNPETSLEILSEPLLQAGIEGVAESCDEYVLAMTDWSRLNFKNHESKADRIQMTHKNDVGYELQTTLLVGDRVGNPLAPVVQNMRTADGLLSTYRDDVSNVPTHLDELTERMEWLEKQNIGKSLVHIIDREADSVAHFRAWKDKNWLVRVKGGSTLKHNGLRRNAKQIADSLMYEQTRMVKIHEKTAWQWVGEASVVVDRPAKPGQNENGKRVKPVKGEPVNARLIVSRIFDKGGNLVAEWFLLSSMKDVPANTLALWYYWRWRIESFFKLLKGAGHNLEDWQQETGMAVAKRLLVVSMACVLVWHIAHLPEETAGDLKKFIVRLSGRQMKRNKPITYPALLAGLWVFLSIMEVLEAYPIDQLKKWAKIFRPG